PRPARRLRRRSPTAAPPRRRRRRRRARRRPTAAARGPVPPPDPPVRQSARTCRRPPVDGDRRPTATLPTLTAMERLRRLLADHRRLLAAGCAGVAVLLALGSVRDSTDGQQLVVAARDLASGTVLTPADLDRVRVPPGAAPDGATAGADG